MGLAFVERLCAFAEATSETIVDLLQKNQVSICQI